MRSAGRGGGWRLGRTLLVTLALSLAMAMLAVAPALAADTFGVVPGSFSATVSSTQAGSHPDATVSFQLNKVTGGILPVDDIKDVVVDLPAGFVGNPQTMPKCSPAELDLGGLCPWGTQVGTISLDLVAADGSRPFPYVWPVFNMVPRGDKTAEFGFFVLGVPVFITASVQPGDHHLRTVIPNIISPIPLTGSTLTLWGDPADSSHNAMRGYRCLNVVCFGGGNPANVTVKPFLRNPTECGKPGITTLTVDSWQNPDHKITVKSDPTTMEGCEKNRFEPELTTQPNSRVAASPSGLTVQIDVPQPNDVGGLATPDLKKAVVKLPAGVTVSPSSADGLQGCTPAQIGLDTTDDPTCPQAAKIGTVRIETPLLDSPMTGAVYLAAPHDNPFHSLLAMYIVAQGSGVTLKLPGRIDADPVTGQLTTTFDDNPQLPFTRLVLSLNDGPRAPLSLPQACGTFTTESTLTSWSGATVKTSSPMTIDQGCAGLGWFGPYFSAGTVNPAAGASSPFALRVQKPDGQSDLNGIALSLPEGLLANLKGNVGRRIGTARVAAGVGPNPYWLSGPVVLEGPYGNAPFSLRVTVPAIAGPFNLGDVVVRQKIYVDPHDAHVTVVSDPFPTILQGIPVQLHDLAVDIDKAGFMRNPTSCAPKSIGGTLAAATGQTAAVSSRFQVGDCAALPLAPKLTMDLSGKKEIARGKHPTLSATLTQQPGESALKQVKVRLPLNLALDPDNAEALCTPEQAAAKACPAASIVGHATAVTPMLDQPLKGDVFFVEGTRTSKTGRTIKTLPKLWVALRGQVAIDLWADSSISKGKYLVTTFGFVPDAPISSFKLDINGGEHGILAVTGASDANLCKQRLVTDATYDGQNGKQVESKIDMSTPCGFRVRSTSLTSTHAKVTLSGLGAGKLSISGRGIHKTSRTIKHADVATIAPQLTAAGQRAYTSRKALRLRVTWNPKKKGAKTRHARATVKRAAKTSSTRAHRTR